MTDAAPPDGSPDAATARIRLGSCPDSWGVWFADDPKQTPWDRFLDELAAAGYKWLELGPHGYLPTDPARLADEVGRRGLEVTGGGVVGALHKRTVWEHDVAESRKVAALVGAMGARYLIYLPASYRDLDGNFTDKRSLDNDGWNCLTRQMSEMGRIVSGDYGVTLVFHPHADTHVGTQEEVDRFLQETDPSAVSLCLDTGHISYCGADNLEIIEQFPDRVKYVHLKQVDPTVLDRVRADDLGFAEAVRLRVMCEPPGGLPDMGPVVAALGRLNADLFAMVEQDLYPCGPDVPLPVARRTFDYYRSIGITG
jgi:inosose dehydratase